MKAAVLPFLLAAALAAPEQSRKLTLAGRWDEAVALLQKEIAAAERRDDIRAQAELRTELARVLTDRSFFHRRDPAAARKALDEALRLARAARDAQSETRALHCLAQLEYSDAFATGDWNKPRSAFLQTIPVRHRLDDRRGLAESWFYVGLTYEQNKEPGPAMDHYRKSLSISEAIGDEVLQSYAHRHIGGIQEERDELDAAEKSISLSLDLRRKAGFAVGVAFALIQLADFVERRRNDRDRAIQLLEEAAEAAKASRSTRASYAAGMELARLCLSKKDAARALQAAKAALAAAREYGDPEGIAAAEKLVSVVNR